MTFNEAVERMRKDVLKEINWCERSSEHWQFRLELVGGSHIYGKNNDGKPMIKRRKINRDPSPWGAYRTTYGRWEDFRKPNSHDRKCTDWEVDDLPF